MSLKAFVSAQLGDPTKALHGLGIAIIAGEVIKHWASGAPVDMNAVTAGFGCIAGGVIQDRVNTPPASSAPAASLPAA